MSTLRALLARFDDPVDVDALEREVRAARRAVEGHRDALRDRVRHTATTLAQATAAARERTEDVERLDARTRGGVVGTLLSSMNSEGVEQAREDAEFKLTGDLTVLETRIEDALALVDQVPELRRDCAFGGEVFERLTQRAIAGELDAATIDLVRETGRAIADVGPLTRGMAAPLDAPIKLAQAGAANAGRVLLKLRSGPRASTVGEAVLDGVVSPDTGVLGQMARKAAAKKAPGLVPKLDREAQERAVAMAELAQERDEARERARRDAEARRLAEAELDALEWDS